MVLQSGGFNLTNDLWLSRNIDSRELTNLTTDKNVGLVIKSFTELALIINSWYDPLPATFVIVTGKIKAHHQLKVKKCPLVRLLFSDCVLFSQARIYGIHVFCQAACYSDLHPHAQIICNALSPVPRLP